MSVCILYVWKWSMQCYYYTLTFHIFAMFHFVIHFFALGPLFISYIYLFCLFFDFFGSSLCLFFYDNIFYSPVFFFLSRHVLIYFVLFIYKLSQSTIHIRKIWFVDNPSYNTNQFSILQLLHSYECKSSDWIILCFLLWMILKIQS